MAAGRVAAAVAMVLATAPLMVVAGRAESPDPAAVEAYIETIESLYADGVEIGDRIFRTRETIDSAAKGKIDKDELAGRLKPEFDTLRLAVEAHRREIRDGAKPANTGDITRNSILLSSLMALVVVPEVLDPMLENMESLQASVTAGDGRRYLVAEVDGLELRAAVYDARYTFLASRLNDFNRDDPIFGIHVAGMGVNQAGVRNFKFLANSLRTGTFDSAAYIDDIEAALQLIETGLASSETAMVNPAWLSARAEEAGENARHREEGLDLAKKYFAEARLFVAATRQSLERLSEELAGETPLSTSEIYRAVTATRLIMAHLLDGTVKMNPIRHELAKLSRSARTD